MSGVRGGFAAVLSHGHPSRTGDTPFASDETPVRSRAAYMGKPRHRSDRGVEVQAGGKLREDLLKDVEKRHVRRHR